MLHSRRMRVPIDGGNPVTIAKIREGVLVTLRISPDGNFLAYAFYNGSKPNTRLSLSVLRASDGGLVNAVEEAKLGAWDFYWAPDGKALDYVSAEDEWTDVWEKTPCGRRAETDNALWIRRS
jgi:tricorn protease-like protein